MSSVGELPVRAAGRRGEEVLTIWSVLQAKEQRRLRSLKLGSPSSQGEYLLLESPAAPPFLLRCATNPFLPSSSVTFQRTEPVELNVPHVSLASHKPKI